MKLMRLLCALWLTSPLIALAQSPLTDDAYVSNASSSVASANNGTSPSLVVQASSGFSYIRFDLSKVLPLNSQNYPIQSNMVAKASLKLYITAVTAGGTVDALEVGGPWCERTGESSCPSTGGVTYVTRPVDGIQIAGASSVTGISSIPITTTAVANSYTAGQYVTVDVTQAVKDWIDYANGVGGHPNYGIVLKPSVGSSVSVTFESKESTTTSHDPQLIVTLSGPQGIQGPTGATGAVGPIGPAGPQPTVTTGGGLEITGTNANGTESLALDPSIAATQGGTNIFTGSDTFKSKVDMSGATATLPIQSVSAQPVGVCGNRNALQLWTGGAAGQQLYICRQTDASNPASLAWSNANDETSVTSSVTAETTRAEAAESTLTSSVATETTRASGAEATLTANVSAESNRAQSAESTLTNNLAVESTRAKGAETTETTRATGAEATLTTNLSAESAARSLADAALGSSINSESSRATAAEGALTSSVTAETARAAAAEATKADLQAPVQPVTAQPSGTCPKVSSMVLWTGGAAGQQLYICRQTDASNPASLAWSNANDESAVVGSVTAETTRAEAAESTLTSSVATETTRATGAEATLTANVSAESNRAQGAESTLTNNLSAESTRAKGAETAETTRAQGAEATLTTNLNTESAARSLADSALGSSINSESSRATAAEGALTSSVTAETARATAAEATKADLQAPVQTVNAQPSGTCPKVSSMVLWTGGAAGQQLYICRQTDASNPASLAWSNANDESAVVGSVTAETTRAEAAESTLTSSVATETTRASGAEATLTANLSAESSRAQGAESTLTNNLAVESTRAKGAETTETARATSAEATLTTNLSAESSRAQGAEAILTTNLNTESAARSLADAALSSSINSESSRATAAEGALTSSVTAETARATAAEATKADLQAPVQTVNAQPSGTCPKVSSMVLWTGGAAGQQLYICRQTDASNPASLAWSNANDESAVVGSVTAETTRAEAAESTLTSSVATETTRATGAEATLTANVSAESSRAQGAESTLTNNLAAESTRAKGAETAETTRASAAEATLTTNLSAESAARSLADATLSSSISNEASRATAAEGTLTSSVTALTNNSATKAANTFTGTQTIGPNVGATAPADSNALAFQSLNPSNQINSAQLTFTKSGLLSLQIGVNGAAPQQQLSFNPDGTINFATNQSFPGNANSVTSGVYTTGSYADPSWITSIAGSKIAGNITGSAASITGSITESQVANLPTDLSTISGALATKATAASITGGTSTKITYNAQGIVTGGAQAASTDLSDTAVIVRNSQANSYTAGMKQTFTPGTQTAGLALAGINSTDPNTLTAGDLWFRSDLKRPRLYDGAASHSLMYSDDAVSNAQLANNSVTVNTPGGSGLSGGGSVALGGSLSLSVPAGGISNTMLVNNTVTVVAGTGLSGGGSLALGQSVTLSNAGVTSLAGTANQVAVSGSTGAVTLSVPRGSANGLASLDASTKVPLAQLPTGASGLATLDSSGRISTTELPSSGVITSVTGTANQITAATNAGAVTLTVPTGVAGGIASLDSSAKVPVVQLPAGSANGIASLDSTGRVPSSQLPSTVVQSGGVSGPSTITVTPGAINKTSCAEVTPSGTFTGLTTSMVVYVTPVGALNPADWGKDSITWVPYVSTSNVLMIHLCNGGSANLTFTSQTFNIRFIN